jgi:hypothetical protein
MLRPDVEEVQPQQGENVGLRAPAVVDAGAK